jgi:hypothetical protein
MNWNKLIRENSFAQNIGFQNLYVTRRSIAMGSKLNQLSDETGRRISSMENRLFGTFKPIQPRREFVRGIARRIQAIPRVAIANRIANWHLLALLIAGLLSITIFLSFLGRALLSLVKKEDTSRI